MNWEHFPLGSWSNIPWINTVKLECKTLLQHTNYYLYELWIAEKYWWCSKHGIQSGETSSQWIWCQLCIQCVFQCSRTYRSGLDYHVLERTVSTSFYSIYFVTGFSSHHPPPQKWSSYGNIIPLYIFSIIIMKTFWYFWSVFIPAHSGRELWASKCYVFNLWKSGVFCRIYVSWDASTAKKMQMRNPPSCLTALKN